MGGNTLIPPTPQKNYNYDAVLIPNYLSFHILYPSRSLYLSVYYLIFNRNLHMWRAQQSHYQWHCCSSSFRPLHCGHLYWNSISLRRNPHLQKLHPYSCSLSHWVSHQYTQSVTWRSQQSGLDQKITQNRGQLKSTI